MDQTLFVIRERLRVGVAHRLKLAPRPDTHDPALLEHDHAIGDAERRVHFVRHDNAGDLELAGQVDDELVDR